MDTVIVNPNNRILSPFAAIEPPLWLGLIATHYRTKGKEVAIVDAEALDLTVEQTAEAIRKLCPKEVIVVVAGNNPSVSSTPKMVVTRKLVELLKDNVPTLVTGLHPSALPKETEEELGVKVMAGKVFDGTPNMPWDLLNPHNYRAHNWHCLNGSLRQPYGVTYTSLGCPFSCSFCNIHALYGGSHKVWYRSGSEVVKEIDTLAERYKVHNIKFWDELFTLNPKHVDTICDLLIERNYDLNIWAYARADCVSKHLLRKMRKAGIKWLAYGFESGSDSCLTVVNKKASIHDAREVVCLTHDADINIIGNFIYGLGYDEETLAFAKSLELEYVNFYEVKPYPGSSLYKKDTNWNTYSQFGDEHTFRDDAFISFFGDGEYLQRIKRKFGPQVVEHINKVLEFGKPQALST